MSRLSPETKLAIQQALEQANRGQIEAALQIIEKALIHAPQDLHLWGHRLFYLLADPNQTQASVSEAFLAYGKTLKPLEQLVLNPDKNPNRRLKIAYLSGHFCQHALARVTSSLFRFHDPQHFEITIYANQANRDPMTDWFEAHCDHFVEVSQFSDQALANRIRQDKIDILVDLAGHSDRHRLRVFTAKPAPVQITAGLGLVSTTGLEAIDYRLADRALIPNAASTPQAETTLYLSHLLHWDPLPVLQALPLQPPPFLEQGFITFGSSNRTYKLNQTVLTTWAEILKQVPGSKLSLKCMHFDNSDIKQSFIERFAQLGITAERLIFTGQTHTPAHVAHFSTYDIALDTFPYQGGLTTFEALHMGVPVIALDLAHGSRASLSILQALGAQDFIAQSTSEYIAKAVQLAQEPQILINWRQQLRQSLFKSGLFHGLHFTREVENAYRWVWQEYCQDHKPESPACTPDPLAQAQVATGLSEWPEHYQAECLEQARLDFEMGRFSHCEDICNQLLNQANPQAEVFHFKGLLAFQFNHFEAAQHLMLQAISLQPEDSTFYVNLGHVYREAGQAELAQKYYQEALRRNPDLSSHFQELEIEVSL